MVPMRMGAPSKGARVVAAPVLVEVELEEELEEVPLEPDPAVVAAPSPVVAVPEDMVLELPAVWDPSPVRPGPVPAPFL